MESPIKFPNKKGEYLFGMIFSPEQVGVKKRIGVILSVNAIKYRIGTFRLHTNLARFLCGLGYFVMTFDPSGIGDSEGVFVERPLAEHYYDIQIGKYCEDVVDAVTYFIEFGQLDSVLLVGLCGGAISMLIAGAQDPRVKGVVLLGVPVLLENMKKKDQETNIEPMVVEGQERRIIISFLGKLLDPVAWRKAVSLDPSRRMEIRAFGRALGIVTQKTIQNWCRSILHGRKRMVETVPVSKHPRFNIKFQSSFLKFVARKSKILFVFAEQDFITGLFKTEFQDTGLYPGNEYERWYEIHVVERANHVFTSRESQLRIMTIMKEWLEVNFPQRGIKHSSGG
jgi:pimeloyl-ACP methyl ester carboxylesterase